MKNMNPIDAMKRVTAVGAVKILLSERIDFVPIPVLNDEDRDRMIEFMLRRIETVSKKGDGK